MHKVWDTFTLFMVKNIFVYSQMCSCFPTTPKESNNIVRAKDQVISVTKKQTHSTYLKLNMSCSVEMCNTVSLTVAFPLRLLNLR